MKYVLEFKVIWLLTLDYVFMVTGLRGFYAFYEKSIYHLILIYFGLVGAFCSFLSLALCSSIIIVFAALMVVGVITFVMHLSISDASNLIILLVETMKKYVIRVWCYALTLNFLFTDFGLFSVYAFRFKSILFGYGFWIATKLLMVDYIGKGQSYGYLILLSWLTLGFWLTVCIFDLKLCLGLPSIICFRTAALLDDLEL